MNLFELFEAKPLYSIKAPEEKVYNPVDPEIMAELLRLPQPITANGGSYSYTCNLVKNPNRWVATDGSVIHVKSIREITEYFDRAQAEDWNRYLSGEEYLDYMVRYNMLSYPNGRMQPPKNQEEHELERLYGPKRKKGLDFKKLTIKPDQLLKYDNNEI